MTPMMKRRLTAVLKVLFTCTLAVLAVVVLWRLYMFYTYAPQTRDGKIRADVVPLAADISGRVEAVYVRDNQTVHKGDLLFSIDKERLKNALKQSEAALLRAKSFMEAADRESERYNVIEEGVVSKQEQDDRKSAAEQACADYEQAVADRDLAKLNLERSDVYSPVNGIVTNFSLRPGVYATAGQPVMTLVDTDSFYIVGYFEETKLRHIRMDMPASIRVMGESRDIRGHVVGLAAGIADSEYQTASDTLLPDVNPTFNWVRLAQRIPTRIAIDHVPKGLTLVAGRTVSVTLQDEPAEKIPQLAQSD